MEVNLSAILKFAGGWGKLYENQKGHLKKGGRAYQTSCK